MNVTHPQNCLSNTQQQTKDHTKPLHYSFSFLVVRKQRDPEQNMHWNDYQALVAASTH